ncbi:MAG: creatininase family protein [Planctomycetaceae bacterium]|nr:MAG: creatininase family protein [Planctomycetaceae bacterium]
MINEWDITTTNLRRIRQRKYEVAVLPLSAVEPHNLHLPEGTDFLNAAAIARKSCELAWPRCESVICLPGLPYGVDCNEMGFPLAIHVRQSTLDMMITEIVASLRAHGIRKIVLLNGHGGNEFMALVRQIMGDLDVQVFLCNWWTVAMDHYGKIFDKPDNHAGQMETSVTMELFGDLVEMEHLADGTPRPFVFEALTKGWVRTSRDFKKMSDVCACGDATGASAARGKEYLEITCTRIADFLVELAKKPIDDLFPFKKA